MISLTLIGHLYNLLRIGKKLTIEIAFTYREDDDGHPMPPLRRVKRGRVSATSRALAKPGAHIVAEEELTGQSSIYFRFQTNHLGS
ncbi:hypothetical protein N7532_004773 [Penicillium argentinense]|uniref:Uncharacterized protein n=1 Tax=Penicillium argentinense TaxID=1131581 RepID=A0A9W9FQ04_9EURO|nr:uncharacterized protein N7532_004773 [Penicillium argentinense]KAJ5104244.1 hypothetical protein N7532_004773 [Penicillium argentinense]